MKRSDIKVGKTYVNRGKGQTRRTVLAIGNEVHPDWYGGEMPPNEFGVEYLQDGKTHSLYLSSFASWAGKESENA